jgi:hypothetical protein
MAQKCQLLSSRAFAFFEPNCADAASKATGVVFVRAIVSTGFQRG